ncbi:MAG: hypothetical protein NZ602_04285 [Thermoguttaceae bacterium]|nr:hypothetical protein [Thermoguttaceae bacterium]MDW8039201.1 hypothetical protein [Thermoguttaceae bacterium]
MRVAKHWWVLMLLFAFGCGGSGPGMRVWGTVTYQGQPIQEGQIVFTPIEGTPGPSTPGQIKNGQYEIPKHIGPYAKGGLSGGDHADGAGKDLFAQCLRPRPVLHRP